MLYHIRNSVWSIILIPGWLSQLDSEPPPPSPFNPEMDHWAETVFAFCEKYRACDPPFPGYPIMVGYPVGIGVCAEDLTFDITDLEPGFEFSKMLRWRTYGILVNEIRASRFGIQKKMIIFLQLYEARATGPKIVVEMYAVSAEEVDTKLVFPIPYPTVGV